MKKYIYIIIVLVILIILIGVGFMLFGNRESKQNNVNNGSDIASNNGNNINNDTTNLEYVDGNTTVGEVINDKDFEGFGNLIFPVEINIDKNTIERAILKQEKKVEKQKKIGFESVG